MLSRLRARFSTKLILLISLVFLIPVVTALVTIRATSTQSLVRFDAVLDQPDAAKKDLIREIFPSMTAEEMSEPDRVLRLLRDYEHRRTFGLVMSLMVISVALAAVVLLLSMLVLKRGMLSLHELSLAAVRVGEGDFRVDLAVRSHDEFAHLVTAFQTMAQRLNETTVSRDFYTHALESMPAAVFTLDAENTVTTWNRQAVKLTGVPADEAIGRSASEFESVVGPLARPEEIPCFGREAVIRARGGRQRIVSKGVDVLPEHGGRASGIIETFVDMSEQKKLERQLIAAKERAEESSRLRSEFLANMSHEIRTPLNGILGLAEMLAEEETDPEHRSNLETIRQCGKNLLHLINEILELSKIEAGKMVLKPSVVAVAAVVDEAMATIEVACQKKEITLVIDIAEEVPATIETDPRKLAQVLVNLLGNALKFTERGSIRVGVSPYRGTRRGDMLFEVADTGIGIPPDRQQHIFESFVQAEGYLTRSSEGTGLGLAIARKLVDLMGGEMWLESEPGKGSTFSFTIESGLLDEDRR